jgi:hypothetical protein
LLEEEERAVAAKGASTKKKKKKKGTKKGEAVVTHATPEPETFTTPAPSETIEDTQVSHVASGKLRVPRDTAKTQHAPGLVMKASSSPSLVLRR